MFVAWKTAKLIIGQSSWSKKVVWGFVSFHIFRNFQSISFCMPSFQIRGSTLIMWKIKLNVACFINHCTNGRSFPNESPLVYEVFENMSLTDWQNKMRGTRFLWFVGWQTDRQKSETWLFENMSLTDWQMKMRGTRFCNL